MLPPELFRRPDFTGAQIAAFAISGSFFALFLYTTLYLQEILHLSAIQAGLVYLPGTMLIFIVSGASAALTSKVGPSVLVVTGLMLVAGGLALMLLAEADSSWTALMPGLLVGCVGTGLFNPAVVAIALGSVSEEQSGLAAGTNDAFRQGGIAVGVAVFGAVVPAASALGGGSPTDYVSGMHTAAIIGAALAAGRSGRLRPPVPRRPRLVEQAPGRGSGSSRIALSGSQRRQFATRFRGPAASGPSGVRAELH